MVDPVVGVRERLRRADLAGAVQYHGGERLLVLDLAGHGLELLQDRFHHRRMERVRGVQFLALEVLSGQRLQHAVDASGVARNDHASGPVDGRDSHLGAIDKGLHLGFGGEHCHHLSSLRKRSHQPTTSGNESAGVFERHVSCHAGGHIFPDAVPKHHGGLHTPPLPQLGKRIFEGE